MKNILWVVERKNEHNVFRITSFLLVFLSIFRIKNTLGCPALIKSDKCLCYKFEDDVFLDCQDTSLKDISNALQSLTFIHTFSIYDLDSSEENLGPYIIPQNTCIKHVHISRTSLKEVNDEAFAPLKKCLETISIVSSKVKLIPQKALSGMLKLLSVEFTSNYIEEIPNYSFYGLPLLKLNIKGNMVQHIADKAFSGLENTITDIDLSENNLTSFPIIPIANLKLLQTLRLSWNEISSFPDIEHTGLKSLEYLDLNSNNFEFISEDCLKFSPSLTILSFHFNFIVNIHYRAFYSLVNLKSIDLSYNRIKILNSNLFQNNKLMEFINLSHNHLHHINGLICGMPSLTKILLSNNNILEVPIDSFHNSTKISILHLDKNCISNIHSESFSDLEQLVELRLDFNYLNQVPHSILMKNKNLATLRLDNNNFIELNNSTFKTLAELKEIRLNDNKLTFLTKNLFLNLAKVETLYLDHNQISFIESQTFTKLLNLKYISLNNNKLIDIQNILPKTNFNLLSLYLHSNRLTSVNNFESQDKLYLLTLKDNQIKFVTKQTFGNLTYLTRLELGENEISIINDFSFQRLISARYLDLQHNNIRNITSFTFFGLLELEDLDLSYNKINFIYDMAFEHLKKLRSLNLSFNPLKILYKTLFQQLPLSSLYLDNCEIQVIENGTFQNLNNLKILSLSNNFLKSNDLLTLDIPGLKFLSLSHNILDYLPVEAFAQLPLLEILFLEHCNIEQIIEGTFTFNKNLHRFNVAQNIISTIPSNLFGPYNSVSELNISNNFLDYVPYNTFHNFTMVDTLDFSENLLPKVELSGFEKLINLKYLILRKNEIQLISCRKRIIFDELLLLDISCNRLDHLPNNLLENFPSIQNINISNNHLVHFDFLFSHKRIGISLINIDISKNPSYTWTIPKNINENNILIANLYELHICTTNLTNVEDINFELLKSLQHLYLKYNKIRRLSISPFSKLNYLENLDLSYNRITHLKTSNFRGLVKLNALCLSHNNIESMDSFDEDLRNLKLLDLSYNKLQNILNDDLIHLKELTVLYLGFNNIKYISATAFKTLNKIIEIDLQHNKLQNIPIELLNSIENHVKDISIEENVIICRCQKNNTWTWIQDHPKIIKPNAVKCFNDEYPNGKCNFPLIAQVSVDKHNDNSVSVSWFIRNRTSIKAIQIMYYDDDDTSEVYSKLIDTSETSTSLDELHNNMNYIVCVLAIYEYPPVSEMVQEDLQINKSDFYFNSLLKMNRSIAAIEITQSSSSECVSFDTFKKPLTVKMKNNKVFKISSILNRRLGLIVGCSLGVVVFFVMVSVLLYTKIKERKRIAKSDPAWSEMNDYHSIHSKEDILQSSTTASTDNILLGMAKNRNVSLDKIK
ncbi:chaoptin-like [Colias croceus]|uniref:chaoptin-like n=1 Tax=Colias crocea TaxID=72248 RepID=UPI001E28047B|nr:chaoptin-like [Colias croceus]